jgi:YVTN family beta-propeller protein
MTRIKDLTLLTALLLLAGCRTRTDEASPVQNARTAEARMPLQQSGPDDGQWLMPAKSYASTRYSELAEINARNAGNLKVAWTFSTGSTRGEEAAPLIAGSTMYVVAPFPNYLYALDLANSGAAKWVYKPPVNAAAQGRGGRGERQGGLAHGARQYQQGGVDHQRPPSDPAGLSDRCPGSTRGAGGTRMKPWTITFFLLSSLPAAAAPLAYVTNEVAGTVTIFDTATNQVVSTVPMTPKGARPRGVQLTADGKRLYVALSDLAHITKGPADAVERRRLGDRYGDSQSDRYDSGGTGGVGCDRWRVGRTGAVASSNT